MQTNISSHGRFFRYAVDPCLVPEPVDAMAEYDLTPGSLADAKSMTHEDVNPGGFYRPLHQSSGGAYLTTDFSSSYQSEAFAQDSSSVSHELDPYCEVKTEFGSNQNTLNEGILQTPFEGEPLFLLSTVTTVHQPLPHQGYTSISPRHLTIQTHPPVHAKPISSYPPLPEPQSSALPSTTKTHKENIKKHGNTDVIQDLECEKDCRIPQGSTSQGRKKEKIGSVSEELGCEDVSRSSDSKCRKRIQCDQCEYLTTTKYNLKRHTIKHTRGSKSNPQIAKGHVCEICQAAYWFPSDLVRHKKTKKH
ncbi:hypothetical protein CROQUDRAFT_580355 [Cronartium quercuum f. sp. fusiforme G11]|uniref:C2H2-type domain-containing protein n=1 Tax=Cronartium quercuum f. sp. fusiforme G11 TaxID=708437 RepID=A0A9P6TAJ2_9BASI|nr:hypothetical protein CROQUDRAFT_580355 [Cronartium quercuum f. sp. fusiforme G11]